MGTETCGLVETKYKAAKNALVAKYTFLSLDHDQKREVDRRIHDLLISIGIPSHRAMRYKEVMRETQYYGMAAIAMAIIGIRPALSGVLYKDRWESVQNPLVALTGAEKEIDTIGSEIFRKHRVMVSVSDSERRFSLRTLPLVPLALRNLC